MSDRRDDEARNDAPIPPAERVRIAEEAAREAAGGGAGGEEPSIVDRLKGSPVTFAITAINIAVFAWAESHGNTQTIETLRSFGAMDPVLVWKGEYWRLATCMFMHIGFLHIAVNTYAGFGWCALIERAIGRWRFLALYLASGLAGGAASCLASLVFGDRISAGASGAMFGMIGATFALRRFQLGSFREFTSDPFIRSNGMRVAIWVALGVWLRFDNAAHLGGLLAGGIGAWLVVTRAGPAKWVAAAALYAAVVVGAARPGYTPTDEDVCKLYPKRCLRLPSTAPDGDPPSETPPDSP